jgi:hypothetical protein
MRAAATIAMLAAWAALPAGVALARDPGPLRIPLEAMGYQAMLPGFLVDGNSMLTVHFVDADHLLVSFNVRRLMKRELEDPPEDQDRTVAAFLVELPSGKVLARTDWRLHDRGQYLWGLGHGRFLLRVRDRLTVIQPMAAVNPEEAFQEFPFLRLDRRIVAIMVSADDDLLTIETKDRAVPGQGSDSPRLGDLAPANPAPVQINFYRLSSEGPGKLVAASEGAVRSRVAIALPMTTGGFLDVLEGGRDRWLFNFEAYAGKRDELAEFDTTCYPRTTFVSHSEFVAFGCRGSSDRQNIAGFNLKGEAVWQQNFFDTQYAPWFAFAPAAGRFALGRTIVRAGIDPETASLSMADTTSQEVRVYQTYNGKLLFRTGCTPVVVAGQNFALSPDGLRLAVLRETTIEHKETKDNDAYTSHTAAVEIYPLPALTAKDEAAVKQAQELAPEDTGARIDLAMQRVSKQAAATADAAAATPGSAAAATAPTRVAVPEAEPSQMVDQSPPAANPLAWGDTQPEPSRKPPTLYAPGETPDGKPPK